MKRFLLALGVLMPMAASAKPLEEQYPAPWIKADNPSITRAFAESGVEGCGKYRYRVSSDSKSEFLVYCTRGGKATQAFMVWPNIHKLMGPYPPEPSLP
ncbi:hypothetical protein [Pseudomonas sp. GM78]|uniref:hypothetical protein n=1 Tax=Pseudomonas sp. GM78 TaxID=1144337 RepID=UPI0005188539|nr:hypothetical protein [Pseudomonas sp. GM78]